jgi:signal peptidase I
MESGLASAPFTADQELDIGHEKVPQPCATFREFERPSVGWGEQEGGMRRAADDPITGRHRQNGAGRQARLRALSRDVLFVLVTCGTLLVARASLADHYVVPSGSMEPTVVVGDHVCVNKLAYGLRVPESQLYVVPATGPARGDVVVLDSPTEDQVLLKRVVALPGDRVEVTVGRLTLDGQPVATRSGPGEDGGVETVVEQLGGHTHRLGLEFGGGPDLPPTVIPADRYLVLGDNRGNSRDGRYFGLVARGAILGRAEAVCVHEGVPVWRGL